MIYYDCEKVGNGVYATIQSIENKDGFLKGRISTTEKDKNGETVYSNWFVTFGKNCSEKASKLQSKDRILIKKMSLKNPSIKKDYGKYQSYLNVGIYYFDVIENDEQNLTQNPSASGFPKPTPPINDLKTKEAPKADGETSLPFDL